MAFCQNCGKELNDGATFCSNCGKGILNTQTIKNKKQSKKFFISAVCAAILSIVCAITTAYLNATALTGNAKGVLRDFGDYRKLAWVEFRGKLQVSLAYAFIVLLIAAVVLLVIGIVLKQKERANKKN